MIKRIVKLTFRTDAIPIFLEIFEQSAPKILQSEGCHHLELWRAKSPDNVFFTYSYWEDEAALDRYRASDFFQHTWRKTKLLFSERPAAWSVEVLSQQPPKQEA